MRTGADMTFEDWWYDYKIKNQVGPSAGKKEIAKAAWEDSRRYVGDEDRLRQISFLWGYSVTPETLIEELRAAADMMTCYASTVTEYPPNKAAALMHKAATALNDIQSDRDRLVDVVHRLQSARPEVEAKDAEDLALLKWARENPERAVGQIMADWEQCGPGSRELFFSFTASFKFAKKHDERGPQNDILKEKS